MDKTEVKLDLNHSNQKRNLLRMPKILWHDIAIVVGLACNFGAQWLTIFLTTSLQSVVSKTEFLEANPIQRLIQDFQFLNLIWLVCTWALVLGVYLFMRRKRNQDESWKLSFDVATFAIFLMFFIDVWRNTAVILGVLLGG